MNLKKEVSSAACSEEETKLLNRYLMIGWTVIASILIVTYLVEVVKGAFSVHYYIAFLTATVIPYGICMVFFVTRPGTLRLRYEIIGGYVIMYAFVLLTGHTLLVFSYIFPILCLLILYHDAKLILLTGSAALILNLIMILRDARLGRITLLNSRDYEIQIALIVLCFGGCFMASFVYDKISRLSICHTQQILKLQEERIILEERNRYAFIDALTDLGNRRKLNDDTAAYQGNLPEDLNLAVIDVDGLKSVNDILGHTAGDELISGVANVMRTSFPGRNLYRQGGDEFVVIARCPKETFQREIKNFRENMALWKGIRVQKMSASIGTAFSGPNCCLSYQTLTQQADEQMYAEKKRYYIKQGIQRRY